MSDSPGSTAGTGRPPPRWLLKAMAHSHVFLNRLTGGRGFNQMGGWEVCFVSMRGARSERELTIPLMYVPYRDGVLLVASQGGAPQNPAWYRNLVRHPDIVVRHRGRSMKLRARLATVDEKAALWPICDEHYAPYADYRARTTRDMPIFVCQPAG